MTNRKKKKSLFLLPEGCYQNSENSFELLISQITNPKSHFKSLFLFRISSEEGGSLGAWYMWPETGMKEPSSIHIWRVRSKSQNTSTKFAYIVHIISDSHWSRPPLYLFFLVLSLVNQPITQHTRYLDSSMIKYHPCLDFTVTVYS